MTAYKHPDEDGNTARARRPWRPDWQTALGELRKGKAVKFTDLEVDFTAEDKRLIAEACERFNMTPELWLDVTFRVGMAEMHDDDTWMPEYVRPHQRSTDGRYEAMRRWCHWWRDRH